MSNGARKEIMKWSEAYCLLFLFCAKGDVGPLLCVSRKRRSSASSTRAICRHWSGRTKTDVGVDGETRVLNGCFCTDPCQRSHRGHLTCPSPAESQATLSGLDALLSLWVFSFSSSVLPPLTGSRSWWPCCLLHLPDWPPRQLGSAPLPDSVTALLTHLVTSDPSTWLSQPCTHHLFQIIGLCWRSTVYLLLASRGDLLFFA